MEEIRVTREVILKFARDAIEGRKNDTTRIVIEQSMNEIERNGPGSIAAAFLLGYILPGLFTEMRVQVTQSIEGNPTTAGKILRKKAKSKDASANWDRLVKTFHEIGDDWRKVLSMAEAKGWEIRKDGRPIERDSFRKTWQERLKKFRTQRQNPDSTSESALF